MDPNLARTLSTLLAVVVAAPLVGAALNGLLPRLFSRRASAVVGVGASVVSFAAAFWALVAWYPVRESLPGHAFSVSYFSWIAAGPLAVDFALWMDPLSALMLMVVTGIGSLIHLYSVGYMHDDPSFARFFSHLNLFLFSMLLLVLGRSLPIVFVGWEGVGLCSYLLIGFWFSDAEKALAGQKAFVVNRIGDFGFLVAMFLLIFLMDGSLDIPGLHGAAEEATSPLRTQAGMTTLITLLLFLGVTGKSAQIPLYIWLPDAMAGPTPVSALIHAATMVTAGVYLIARLNFLFALAPVTMAVVATVGGLTALFAATIGLVQNDIKKVLAYSTVSQLGYMVLGVGVGAFGAGVFHLMTHAFFKACLFLGAGSVIHALHGEQDIRRMGGLARKMPVTHWTFLLATLAIAGVPGLSGFFSKDEILFEALTMRHASGSIPGYMNVLWFGLGISAALMTAFYMFRLYFLTFRGECRDPHAHPHESPWTMGLPLVVLAAGSVAAGYLGLPGGHGNFLRGFLAPVFEGGEASFRSEGSHALEFGLMGVSTLVALAGIALAAWWYVGRGREMPGRLAAAVPSLHRTLVDKWYVDEAYDLLVVRPLRAMSGWAFRLLDVVVVDRGMVHGPARLVTWIGRGLRRGHNGDVQAYLAVLALGLAVLVFVVW